jgi:CheY-like chemotaxis protein
MPLSTVCIMVVDDYEPLRYLKATLLRKAGTVVCEAKCGREALRMLENPATSALPVIYTSASDRPAPLDPDDVSFQEPFDLRDLIAAIKTSISCARGPSPLDGSPGGVVI